jgi:hypothetical protein
MLGSWVLICKLIPGFSQYNTLMNSSCTSISLWSGMNWIYSNRLLCTYVSLTSLYSIHAQPLSRFSPFKPNPFPSPPMSHHCYRLLQLHSYQSRLWRMASFLFMLIKRGGWKCNCNHTTPPTALWHFGWTLHWVDEAFSKGNCFSCLFIMPKAQRHKVYCFYVWAFLSSKSEGWLLFPLVTISSVSFESLAPSSCSATLATAQEIKTKWLQHRNWQKSCMLSIFWHSHYFFLLHL